MGATRGYHNYRGNRPSAGKAALAVLLVLVILVASGVILLQKLVVYDETGTPRLEIPWQEKIAPEAEGPPPQLDLVIQEPKREALRVWTAAETPLTLEGWHSARTAAETLYGGSCPAVAVTVRDKGQIYFDAAGAVNGATKLLDDTTPALVELLKGETASPYAVARFSCFHDPIAAQQEVETLGLKNIGGYIFYDGNNSQWLDPAKPDARAYLCNLAAQVVELGFDELLLTDLSYPTKGKLNKIAYGDTPKNENLLLFLQELRAALEPYEVRLSVELSADLLRSGVDETAGLVLEELIPLVDRVYAPCLPEETAALAVAAAAAGTTFVPELAEYRPEMSGNCLLY